MTAMCVSLLLKGDNSPCLQSISRCDVMLVMEIKDAKGQAFPRLMAHLNRFASTDQLPGIKTDDTPPSRSCTVIITVGKKKNYNQCKVVVTESILQEVQRTEARIRLRHQSEAGPKIIQGTVCLCLQVHSMWIHTAENI